MNNALKWVQKNQTSILENIKEFLRIPSISAEKEYKDEVLRAAEWVKSNFERIGLETKLFETPGYPVVFAQTKIDPSKPTVLCYFHYDVQPAGEETLWKHKPFNPVLEDGKLWGRGTTDDKLQGMIHVVTLEAMLQGGEELPVNFKFCIEGEEEVSSPNVMNIVRENKDLFENDYIVISDGYMLKPGVPSICVGARGVFYTQIKVSTGVKDNHSGLYGGVIKNANLELVKILQRLKNDEGKILIPGFYEDVLEPTKEELESWSKIPVSDKDHKDASGVFELDEGEKGRSLYERIWSRPTLDINGIWGGFTGEGAKTVIPFEAFAKISMRLVPGQDVDKVVTQFKDYLKSLETEGVKIEMEWYEIAPPFLASPDDPIFSKAQNAYEDVYGVKALLVRSGGTIGLLAGMKELFNKPILMMDFGLPDENMHAPNEFMRIENFWKGVEVSLRLWEKVKNHV